MAYVTNGSAPDAAALRGGGVAVEQGVAVKAGLAVQLMGAAMSMALLIGGVVWGYKLIVRDATGVPVVTAMAGPMREAPANPGGEVAVHTGLAVNAVAALGEAAPPEDVLVLAPPTSDLTDEDLQVMPTAEAEEFHPEAAVPAATDAAPTDLPQTVTLAAPSDQPLSAEDVLALADAISAGAAPLTALSDAPLPPDADEVTSAVEVLEAAPDAEVLADAAADVVADAEAEVAVAVDAVAAAVAAAVVEAIEEIPVEDVAALGRLDAEGRLLTSLRPPSRPAAIAAGVTPAAAEAAPQEVAVNATEVAVGTTLVQLGAFDTPDLAGAEWGRLSERFAEFMVGKERLIQEATSGGRAFYRLRALGFADIADARRFCSALVAEDAACIPVVVQ